MGRARIAIGLTALAGLLAAGFLGYRAWRRHETAAVLAIHTPNGIQEAMFVPIGGIEQWVQIRGEDRRNPVLLVVAGGPGLSMVPLTPVFRSWEKDFTLVQWDQRGTGKTYGANAAQGPMTIARMSADGLEVAQFLRRHLHKDKLIVLGHSWGTILALRMIRARPEVFSAYVGTGQLAAKRENETVAYAMLREKARAAHDAGALAALAKIGPPPYGDIDTLYEERKWQTAYDTDAERALPSKLAPVVLFAPDYSLRDIYDFLTSAPFAQRATYVEENGYDARAEGSTFAVPFFVFQGGRDSMTPEVLARRYFDGVRAPKKDYVVLRGGGHAAMLTMPDAFLHELAARVRPVAVQSETGDLHG